MRTGELGNGRCVPGVELHCGEPRRAAERIGEGAGTGFVVVGEDDGLTPFAFGGEAGDGLPHRSDTDEQDSHGAP
jgi:hypothetical protein